jgi:hypothetical protein
MRCSVGYRLTERVAPKGTKGNALQHSAEKTTFGRVQGAVISVIRSHAHDPVAAIPLSTIVLEIFQTPRVEQTRSQQQTVRRALRTLEQRGIVRLSKYIHHRERCWELTGKVK